MMLGRLQEGASLLDQAVRIDPNCAMGLVIEAPHELPWAT
jgi:hypothetical protein